MSSKPAPKRAATDILMQMFDDVGWADKAKMLKALAERGYFEVATSNIDTQWEMVRQHIKRLKLPDGHRAVASVKERTEDGSLVPVYKPISLFAEADDLQMFEYHKREVFYNAGEAHYYKRRLRDVHNKQVELPFPPTFD